MPGNYAPNDEALHDTYYCERETLAGLRQVVTRLYADKPLIGDARRDLANRMWTLLGQIEELPVKRVASVIGDIALVPTTKDVKDEGKQS